MKTILPAVLLIFIVPVMIIRTLFLKKTALFFIVGFIHIDPVFGDHFSAQFSN
jgi:hypothetical protein